METLRTEEEQIAALKKWWQDNGNSLLIGIGFALAIVFGWKAYQNSVQEERVSASLMYQQLVAAATQTQPEEGEEAATVAYLAGELKSDFPSSEYARYAAMFLAKEAVDGGELEQAISELNWILENTEDQRLIHVVKGRIARILSVQGKHEEALAMLNATDAAFEASYLEIKGDIYERTGDEASAIKAYKEAYALVADAPQAQPLLMVKLADLGVNPESL